MPLISLSQVQAASVKWLWSGRIPLGAITLLDGDGGSRKSTLALNIAAAVTLGRALPGANIAMSGAVLLLGEEDGYSETVRPRLEAMHANLSRVFFFEDEAITLFQNLDQIEKEVMEKEVKLIVIDPLSGFIGTDSNREQDVRRVLTRVCKMAARTGAAVLAIRHLTKSRAAAAQAGVGSVGIGAVARSGMVMVADPAGTDEIVLAQYKSNLAVAVPSLRLRFDGVRLQVLGESRLGPNDLVKATAYNEHSALGEAVAFLTEVLSQGGVTRENIHKLATKAGINHRTLRKAKDVLGVVARHAQTFQGPWRWHMRGDDRLAPEPVPSDPATFPQVDLALQGHLGGTEAPPSTPPPSPTPGNSPRAGDHAVPSPHPQDVAPPRPINGGSEGTRFSLLEVD